MALISPYNEREKVKRVSPALELKGKERYFRSFVDWLCVSLGGKKGPPNQTHMTRP
jgi:hypothetical protein